MFLETDFEEFCHIWGKVFENFNPRDRVLDDERERIFKRFANEYSLEEVRAAAEYIIDNFRYYPCVAEIREALNTVRHEARIRSIMEYERQRNEEFMRHEEELRQKIERMSPEEQRENRRKCNQMLRSLDLNIRSFGE